MYIHDIVSGVVCVRLYYRSYTCYVTYYEKRDHYYWYYEKNPKFLSYLFSMNVADSKLVSVYRHKQRADYTITCITAYT